jgi:RIO kinase 1
LKKIETKTRQIESEIDNRRMKRRRDQDELKVVEGVIDPPTLKVLYRLLNRGVLKTLHGVVSAGKEANVYRGEDGQGESVAVKIYRMSTAERDYMLEYIAGDPRFGSVPRKTRQLIPKWALKEFRNLKLYYEAGVRVPRPIEIDRNVLVMEFIGDRKEGVAAPLLRSVKLEHPDDTFNEIVWMIEEGYTKARLVHADLSEYNIMWYDGPVIIDVSQSVLISHNSAGRYLFRDIQNITKYFRNLGVETEEPSVIATHIISSGEHTDANE